MVIIAINGKAKRGKNTFANLLIGSYICLKNEDPYNCSILAFADPLKEMVLQMYPQARRDCLFGPSELRENKIPGLDFSYRDILLKMGKFTRNIDQDIWTNHLYQRILNSKSKLIVISDLRFKNEREKLINNFDVITIRIKRDIDNESLNESDISEIDLDSVPDNEFSNVIINNSDLKSLREKAENIIKSII